MEVGFKSINLYMIYYPTGVFFFFVVVETGAGGWMWVQGVYPALAEGLIHRARDNLRNYRSTAPPASHSFRVCKLGIYRIYVGCVLCSSVGIPTYTRLCIRCRPRDT